MFVYLLTTLLFFEITQTGVQPDSQSTWVLELDTSPSHIVVDSSSGKFSLELTLTNKGKACTVYLFNDEYNRIFSSDLQYAYNGISIGVFSLEGELLETSEVIPGLPDKPGASFRELMQYWVDSLGAKYRIYEDPAKVEAELAESDRRRVLQTKRELKTGDSLTTKLDIKLWNNYYMKPGLYDLYVYFVLSDDIDEIIGEKDELCFKGFARSQKIRLEVK